MHNSIVNLPAELQRATLPEWVCWIAQDRDGAWWGYAYEPLAADTGWYENEVGRSIKLAHGHSNEHWRTTLHAVADKGSAS